MTTFEEICERGSKLDGLMEAIQNGSTRVPRTGNDDRQENVFVCNDRAYTIVAVNQEKTMKHDGRLRNLRVERGGNWLKLEVVDDHGNVLVQLNGTIVLETASPSIARHYHPGFLNNLSAKMGEFARDLDSIIQKQVDAITARLDALHAEPKKSANHAETIATL